MPQITAIALLLLTLGCARKPEAEVPSRLGRNLLPAGSFESLPVGAAPPRWTIANGADATVRVTDDHPLHGARSLRVTLAGDHIPPGQPVLLTLALPQARVAGQDVVLSAVSNGSAEAVAQLDSQVDGRIPPTWARLTDHFEMAHHVPSESTSTTLSLRVFGTKGSWITIDDLSVRVVR